MKYLERKHKMNYRNKVRAIMGAAQRGVPLNEFIDYLKEVYFEDGTKIDVIDLSDETFERIIFKGEVINLSHVELRNILTIMTDVTGGKGYFTELEDPDDWLSKNT